MIKCLKNSRKLTRALAIAIVACAVLGGVGVAIAAEATPTNIAKTSSIYAEVTDPFWEANGYGTSALVDGVTGGTNYFSTEDYNTPDVTKEVYFSFHDTYKISEIRLVSPSNRSIPKDFTISAWNGNSWVEIANEKDISVSGGAAYTKSGLEQTCSGLRIRATKLSVGSSSTKYSMRFSEIEIMGVEADTKLAAPIVCTMNAARGTDADNIQMDWPDWATDFTKEKLVDGDTTGHKNFCTTGSLKEDAEKEIYLTLDGTYQMNEVALYPAMQILNGTKQYVGGFPVDFTVSIWNGNEWKEAARQTGAFVGAVGTAAESVKPIRFEFPVIEGNAVRINVTKQGTTNAEGTQFALRLAEIEVNGVKSGEKALELPDIVFEAKDIAKTADVDGAIYTFDKTYKVNEVIISKADFPKAFEVSVWDGTAWKKAADRNSADFSEGRVCLTFDAVDCRAIRITGDSTIPSLDAQTNEIVIHGVDTKAFVNVPEPMANAAYKAVVEMECPDWAAATLGPAQLVDGNVTSFTTTAYASDAAASKTVKVTFANAYEISKVNLYPRLSGENYKADGGFPVAFKVLVWDGEVWKEVKNVTQAAAFSGSYPMLSLALETAQLCNAIKIEVSTLGASDNSKIPYVLQLAELEVLGQKSDQTLNAPDAGNEPGEYTGVNAALNGTVEMNVAAFAKDSFPKERLVDGKTATFTTSEYSVTADKDESAAVIFKDGAYTIDRIVLSPRIQNGKVYGFPEDFKVSVWDGAKWVEVVSKTGYASDGKNLQIDITATLCNAVKIDVTKLGASDNAKLPYTFQLAELEAWGQKATAILAAPPVQEDGNTDEPQSGTNAALDGTVTMNVPNWATSFPGSKLVDGVTSGNNNFATTEYKAKAETKETIIVAFKDGAYSINNIRLYPRVKDSAYNGGFPVDFTVSVWNGSEWVTVITKTGVVKDTADRVSLDITPTVCNALKIDVTKMGESENAGKYTLQLAEIQAFGEKSSQELAAAPTSANTAAAGNGTVVTIDNNRNLALNRPAKASTDLAQYNAPVEKVNDGSIGSYWASNDTKFVKGEAQWVEINLLNNFSIHTVILGARQNALGFPYDFKIEVFYDGEWIEAYSQKGFEANEKAGYTAYEFNFPAVIGNKIRVSSDNFRKVGSSNSMVLSEVAVYGDSVSGNYVLPNENMITSGVAITATTSMEDYDYYLVHLVDNNLATGWSCVSQITADSVQTVEVDMKGEVQLSELQLKPSWGGHGFPVDFKISVLENGTWVDVYEANDYEKPEDEAIQRFQFETKKITKFKITVTKLDEEAGLYVWKMNEIMAYPSHTGDEFDPNRVEEVNSAERLEAAEVITEDGKTDNSLVRIQLWKIIVGGILFLVAVGGCAAILISFRKKRE